ncbi:MAG: hypothetical protein Q8O55_09685 [Dehalococcoidales bacterium]|nr:hypothetical protein [Dehalococcoidales bacterium]
MKPVIQVSGKAKHVFKYMELLSRHKGSMTLKDLAKDNKTFKLDLR